MCVDGGVGGLDLKYDVETVFWCVDLSSFISLNIC